MAAAWAMTAAVGKAVVTAAVLAVVAAPAGLLAAAEPVLSDGEWFCSHEMGWKECKANLPSEEAALNSFFHGLETAGSPEPHELEEYGIVMSGGPGHVLQAMANLHILRTRLKCVLAVEFWHAYEIKKVHCDGLQKYGAYCKPLRVPGVYPLYQTTMPAILSSSFQHVIWLDTDVTPLYNPELLFATRAYAEHGAMFWPDLWGRDCKEWGQTSWPNHVAWKLLNITYNETDPSCINEHEAGYLLVDKVRHWKPLLLANYLASRHFFTRVMHGYKDVFRLAWLKLRASSWLCPVRPGRIGAVRLESGDFCSKQLVHWWPAGDEPVFNNSKENLVLYVHQKKEPMIMWQAIVIFHEKMGECAKSLLVVPARSVRNGEGMTFWDMTRDADQALYDQLILMDVHWNMVFETERKKFAQHPDLSPAEVDSMFQHRQVDEASRAILSCECQFLDNRWLYLLTTAISRQNEVRALRCEELLSPLGQSLSSPCLVGHAMASIICSQKAIFDGRVEEAKAMAAVAVSIQPKINACMKWDVWPLVSQDLLSFVVNVTTGGDAGLRWNAPIELNPVKISKTRVELRRCVPLRDLSCWTVFKSDIEDQGFSLEEHPTRSCVYCCNPANRGTPAWDTCWGGAFTEENCCQPVVAA